ncbi:MAG TPA: DUF3857 domain-containing protein [Segetibacter sp.]
MSSTIKSATAFGCALLFAIQICCSQTPVSDFGVFSTDEINLKQCDFDVNADAVVLLDKAVSTYNDQYNLRTERRIRMKILKERGIDRGNIRINYYSGDDFEGVYNIEATVLSFDNQGNQVWSKLDRKSIYTKKLNKYYSQISFALPNIKVGSIIEYKYERTMKHYGGLREWIFQSDMPVVLSSYHLAILPNAEFAYSVYKISDLPIKVVPNKDAGTVWFEMQKIPGLREEAYMSSEHDYLQRVQFQFAGYNQVQGTGFGTTSVTKTSYTTTWKLLAKEMLESGDFGSQINKTLPGADLLQLQWAKETDAFTRMKTIHDFVKTGFNWNHMNSKYADEGIKGSWEKRSGTSGEINIILINLLKSAGLSVQPLLVSDRDHGKIDTTYPYTDQFNKVVAYVKINDRHYILDGSDRETPTSIIPFDLLNTIGFIVDKKNSALVKITDAFKKNLNIVKLTANINNDGRVKLNAEVDSYDYAKIEGKENYERNKNKYEKDFFEPYNLPVPDSFKIDGLEADSLAMHHNAKVQYSLNKTGDYFLLNYNLFTGFSKNPFINEQRFTDINFGCEYNSILSGTFTLPDNLSPEALPKSVKMITPDHAMEMVRQVKQTGNTVQIDVRIGINKTQFDAEEYTDVQSFYKQMIDMLNEPIVLKAKS